MKRYEELENLTQTEKTEYLAKYLARYIEDVISKFTSSKELTNEVINDNTIMYMIKYVIDNETAKTNNISNALNSPFENTFYNYSNINEYNHILYELIIK